VRLLAIPVPFRLLILSLGVGPKEFPSLSAGRTCLATLAPYERVVVCKQMSVFVVSRGKRESLHIHFESSDLCRSDALV
jgi:hypothetical protein